MFNSEVGQKVPRKAIGQKVGLWNSFGLDGTSDASLDPEMMFKWIDCLGTIHSTSKLGWEEPLKPTNISLYNVSFLISHLVQQLQAKQLIEEVKLHIWSSTFAFLL